MRLRDSLKHNPVLNSKAPFALSKKGMDTYALNKFKAIKDQTPLLRKLKRKKILNPPILHSIRLFKTNRMMCTSLILG